MTTIAFTSLSPALQGFATCGGLILAIGAQNAFVLQQGVRGRHHVPIALLCIVCDVLVIGAGVAGLGAAAAAIPWLTPVLTLGGAAFLTAYGLRSARSAWRGGARMGEGETRRGLGAALGLTLAVTFLNPHFYIDTVVLMGGIGARLPGAERWLFWIGASLASTVWFLSLSLGARALAPVLDRPASWRVLDAAVAVVMFSVAAGLAWDLMDTALPWT